MIDFLKMYFNKDKWLLILIHEASYKSTKRRQLNQLKKWTKKRCTLKVLVEMNHYGFSNLAIAFEIFNSINNPTTSNLSLENEF